MTTPIITYYLDGKICSKAYLINNNILHHENEPAETFYYENGNKASEYFYINGKLHNENGPAAIYYNKNGNINEQFYYFNNKILENVSSIKELKRYIKLNNIS